MASFSDILKSLQEPNEGALDVLTTIIKVVGSAYRKEGTSMLIHKDGQRIGLLSAGCLEEDLSSRVQSEQAFQRTETLIYDMSNEDDLSWGQGAGCNGVLHVLIEPITPSYYDHLLSLRKFLNSGYTVDFVRKLNEARAVTDYIFIAENGGIFGDWEEEDTQMIQELEEWKKSKQKSTCYKVNSSNHVYFFQTFHPKPRLILFGAGDDAIPLASFASETGYSVTVADWRPGLCHPHRFPKAEQLLVGTPSEILNQLTFTAYDSIIVLSHVFQKDRDFLKLIQNEKINYIGILGSKTRTKRLLDGLDLNETIHSPVGLSIGAEGPEEIAISILAELIQLKSQRAYKTPKDVSPPSFK